MSGDSTPPRPARTSYQDFLARKTQLPSAGGFEPTFIPAAAFPFQRHLIDWSVRRGRAALFAGTGLGKSLMQLAWGQNVVERTNRPVLALTPLAVAPQMVREAHKFGIDAVLSRDGKYPAGARVVVTNYQRLHYFSPSDFAGCDGDESSCLKDAGSRTNAAVKEFMRTLPYRLLGTAMPSPNDYFELGTSSEAIGELGYQDMLTRFFRQQLAARGTVGWGHDTFVLRKHAETEFWRWVCSWARAVRMPSDLGYDDGPFTLPPLTMRMHEVTARRAADGFLFDLPATTMMEQREEERRTVRERCEMAAALAAHDEPAIVWCHRNDEGDLLEELIADCVQVSGSDGDDRREEKLAAFISGEARVLIAKPQQTGYGLNLQHCRRQVFFPTHSYQHFFQAVRRCWRFGQTREVIVDVVTTSGGAAVMANLERKSENADRMFARLAELMNAAQGIDRSNPYTAQATAPAWMTKEVAS